MAALLVKAAEVAELLRAAADAVSVVMILNNFNGVVIKCECFVIAPFD